MSRLGLFRTADHDCGYLPDPIAREAVVDPDAALNPAIFEQLLAAGFRRSGDRVYRPHCPDCSACVPVRIPLQQFRPNRAQRRCLRDNADLVLKAGSLAPTAAHADLFRRYLATRHPGTPMGQGSDDDLLDFLDCAWADPVQLDVYLPDGRLAGFAITDQTPLSWSAVYTAFDPDMNDRGLGTWAVLQQVQLARGAGRHWLYLGYWIAAAPSMRYKTRFKPLEALQDGLWLPMDDA